MLTRTDEAKIRQLPSVRLTRSERQELEAEAERLGLSLSAYTRQALRVFVTLTRGGLTYDETRPQA